MYQKVIQCRTHRIGFYVLTGGPGSGKTTLIEALRSAGFTTTTEAGRAIIRDQLEIGDPRRIRPIRRCSPS